MEECSSTHQLPEVSVVLERHAVVVEVAALFSGSLNGTQNIILITKIILRPFLNLYVRSTHRTR